MTTCASEIEGNIDVGVVKYLFLDLIESKITILLLLDRT